MTNTPKETDCEAREWFVELMKDGAGGFDKGGWAWAELPEDPRRSKSKWIRVISFSAFEKLREENERLRETWKLVTDWVSIDNMRKENVMHPLVLMHDALLQKGTTNGK